MLDKLNNIGNEIYQSWNEDQRREEIAKLVQGYRNGLPAEILCQLATSIAGSREVASEHLVALLSRNERKSIVKNAGNNRELRSFLKDALL